MPPPFVRPFHFWCQKVLPLVFDDSLSYYEVLAKMRDYLNTAIQEINEIGSEFDGVKTQLTELKTYVDEYFAGLDVNQAISDKLDNMVESGEMDAVITPIFAAYANPLFAASVADMVATNFAYANYENNKIYTFNQSTGLYQTTGKEFGGVVSSVDEMEDNDKYYALDSDGMLYSYDYPQAAFVATGLTYGGYRYGVNAMRPISNVYVLTTDSHVYTWNGTEYVDSGVVYGLNNTAFIWRRKLTNNDDIRNLSTDGWYHFTSDDIPSGLPDNAEISDGFVVVYSIPDSTGNVITERNSNIETQRSQNVLSNSRNKRIVLRTVSGGCWAWDGVTWISNSENGYSVCTDCSAVNWNGVLTCNESTNNTPDGENGLLKTFVTSDSNAQMFFNGNKAWFRYANGEWTTIATNAQIQTLSNALTIQQSAMADLVSQINARLNALDDEIATTSDNLNNLTKLLTIVTTLTVHSENEFAIETENNKSIAVNALVAKTDSSLTTKNVPGDSMAIGERFNEVEDDIALANSNITTNTSDIATLKIKTSEITDNVNEIAKTTEKMSAFIAANTTTVSLPLNNQQDVVIACENGEAILGEGMIEIITDATLTKNLPANAKAVGDRISANENAIAHLNDSSIAMSNDISQIQRNIAVAMTNTELAILGEDNAQLCSENNENISATTTTLKTDKTLSEENIPADAKTVGELTPANDKTKFTLGLGRTYYPPVVEVYGTLPTSKTKVNVNVIVRNETNTIVYNGHAKMATQGQSTNSLPKKNYHVTLDRAIRICGYSITKLLLKANYSDSTMFRNIVCARVWNRFLHTLIHDDSYNSTITTQNNASITTENNESVLSSFPVNPVTRSQHWGTTDGECCALFANGEFVGAYTLQIPKSELFGMDLSQKQVVISVENWNFNRITSMEDFLTKCEIEDASPDMTDEIVYQKVKAFADFVNDNSGNAFANGIQNYTNPDIVLAYMALSATIGHYDGVVKNFLLYSYDGGNTFNISPWDMDLTLGNWSYFAYVIPGKIISYNNQSVSTEMDAMIDSLAPVQNLGRNILFAKCMNALKNRFKEVFNNGVEGYLNAKYFLYDFMCLSMGVPKTLIDREILKWPMRPRMLQQDYSLIYEWIVEQTRVNKEYVDTY